MEIVKYPHPSLLKVCREVTVFGPELKVLLESMFTTMEAASGIGMAANQVGLGFRMFTMKGLNDEKIFVVNPKIVELSQLPCSLPEGCLSFPGQMIKLYRPGWVTLEFQNEKGEALRRTFSDILSVCVQHECEHLEGKSFIQNKAISKKVRRELAKRWGLE